MNKLTKKLVSFATAAVMTVSAAALPAMAETIVTYEPVGAMTNMEAYAASGTYYAEVNGDYAPVTVTYSRDEQTVTTYVAGSKTYDESQISTQWTASNGIVYQSASPYVTSTLQTYTRTSKKNLLVTYFWYVNDKTGKATSKATSAAKARKNFSSANEFHNDGATGKSTKTDDPYYVAATYTAVKPVVNTTVTETYTYTAKGQTIATSTDTACPVALFERVETTVADPVRTGTFTVASMNVDGLPNKILGISINGDGPGSSGTKALSKAIATRGWDFFAVSEDFNYNTELMSALSDYNAGTHGGKVTGLTNKTDGLNLIWKKDLTVTGEKRTKWSTSYSTGIFNTGNGADGMINKGFRYYAVTMAEGVTVDVYITHMDADSDAGDIKAREAQIQQLVKAIKATNNGNPIIFMGDTNCRYTRERLKELFVDELNKDKRFSVVDPWVEKAWNGVYPTYGADSIMAEDKGGPFPYPQAEIVDKMFVINNTDSSVKLNVKSYTVDTTLVDANGKPLADHWPIVTEIEYTAK